MAGEGVVGEVAGVPAAEVPAAGARAAEVLVSSGSGVLESSIEGPEYEERPLLERVQETGSFDPKVAKAGSPLAGLLEAELPSNAVYDEERSMAEAGEGE